MDPICVSSYATQFTKLLVFLGPCRTLRGKPLESKEQEILSLQWDYVFNSEGAVGKIPAELIVT